MQRRNAIFRSLFSGLDGSSLRAGFHVSGFSFDLSFDDKENSSHLSNTALVSVLGEYNGFSETSTGGLPTVVNDARRERGMDADAGQHGRMAAQWRDSSAADRISDDDFEDTDIRSDVSDFFVGFSGRRMAGGAERTPQERSGRLVLDETEMDVFSLGDGPPVHAPFQSFLSDREGGGLVIDGELSQSGLFLGGISSMQNSPSSRGAGESDDVPRTWNVHIQTGVGQTTRQLDSLSLNHEPNDTVPR